MYISRHVVFNEEDFPFKTGFLNTHKGEEQLITNSVTNFENLLSDFSAIQDLDSNSTARVDQPSSTSASEHIASSSGERAESNSQEDIHTFSPPSSKDYEVIDSENQLDTVLDIPQNASGNIQQSNTQHQSLHPMITRSKSGIHTVKTPYVGNVSIHENQDNLSLITEPTSVDKAL